MDINFLKSYNLENSGHNSSAENPRKHFLDELLEEKIDDDDQNEFKRRRIAEYFNECFADPNEENYSIIHISLWKFLNYDQQNNLGYCYENGIGTTKDEEKAFQWYLRSAEDENNNGQNNLGYYYNDIGTTKDEEKTFHWYIKSAEG
ncbi:hypothetical protein Glove_386g34 [Diversispora epigaea]|uniref:Sel1 repeat protein n=1 Tax=Diversispora epigaea TaxID=1348612 RepID=A0A397HAV7_9GLOM|nr:hypothetical protein Glove_386g34 [Diversispora epigaea]